MNGGNALRSQKQLAEQGVKVEDNTLTAWRDRFSNRYADICARHARQIEEVVVQTQREVALAASRTVRLAIEKAHERLERNEDREPARTAQALQTTTGIAVSKILELTGRPTAVVEHRSADEILRRLQAMQVIESTAEEVAA